MKKIFFASCCLFFLSSAFSQGNTSGINCLKFSTIDAYEEAIENYFSNGLSGIEGYSTYVSLKSTFVEEQPPAAWDDEQDEDDYDVNDDVIVDDTWDIKAYDVLSDLLNEDKVMIIGNWFVKVDLENQRGLIMNTSQVDEYEDFLANNLSNQNITVLGMDENGVETLRALEGEETLAPCNGAKRIKDEKNFYNGNRKRINAKAVYQKAIFVFSLEGKGKTQKRFLRIWWHDGGGNAAMSHIELSYHRRCSDVAFQYYGDPCQNGCLSGYSAGSTCSYRPYLSVRGLTDYDYLIDFVSTHGNGRVEIHGQ